MRNLIVIASTIVAFAAAPAAARDASFVSADQTRALQILPAPAANDSERTKAELEELHRVETTRTAAETAQAVEDDRNEHIFVFKTVFGDAFSAEKLPGVAAFGKRVKNDEGVNSAAAKAGFHRVRPYNLDRTLHPVCAVKTKDDSYPSGHATSGYLLALNLVDMVPEKRDEILARADAYAWNRVICGVHYSSDLLASKLLAYSIHAIMTQNPRHREEMAIARTELRTFLGLPDAEAASPPAPRANH